jgi:hypothetical protein
MLVVSNWEGWSNGAIFRGNTFDVAGTGHFGHELRRNQDGTYEIAAGWGGAKDIRFVGNRYFGQMVDLPVDAAAVVETHFQAVHLPWKEPIFDPAHPADFATYLAKHRRWMLRLFTSQFNEPVHLGISQPFSDQASD